jgi:DNA-binding MarR family transcriptional regulator
MNKPILFNTEMVQAIMDGRKTVTRRIVKQCPTYYHGHHFSGEKKGQPKLIMDWDMSGVYEENGDFYLDVQTDVDDNTHEIINPPYQIGDVMWVRETWKILDVMESASMRFEYLAGGKISDAISVSAGRIEKILKFLNKKGWLPSLFMPREAARIFLRVTDVRAERLQEITADEARKEGITDNCNPCKVGHLFEECETCPMRIDVVSEFQDLWNSTIKPADLDRYGWDANPFVWVISFERCEKPEGFDS